MKTNTCATALEVADEKRWFKSSYSGDNGGGGCVSIAVLTSHVGVRDSKEPNGPAFVVPATAWASFIGGVTAGRPGR
ncbi:DUF397 domain-containing protein [Streptomyces sp. NPDC000405]|uniref:DUF397 domain-containing protein n=1 Tax=Streptomyces sp. NPDC000405 TaxID=3161033 RepID=UPI00398C920A